MTSGPVVLGIIGIGGAVDLDRPDAGRPGLRGDDVGVLVMGIDLETIQRRLAEIVGPPQLRMLDVQLDRGHPVADAGMATGALSGGRGQGDVDVERPRAVMMGDGHDDLDRGGVPGDGDGLDAMSELDRRPSVQFYRPRQSDGGNARGKVPSPREHPLAASSRSQIEGEDPGSGVGVELLWSRRIEEVAHGIDHRPRGRRLGETVQRGSETNKDLGLVPVNGWKDGREGTVLARMASDVLSVDPDVRDRVDSCQGQDEGILPTRHRQGPAIPPGAVLDPATVLLVVPQVGVINHPGRNEAFVDTTWYHRVDPLAIFGGQLDWIDDTRVA